MTKQAEIENRASMNIGERSFSFSAALNFFRNLEKQSAQPETHSRCVLDCDVQLNTTAITTHTHQAEDIPTQPVHSSPAKTTGLSVSDLVRKYESLQSDADRTKTSTKIEVKLKSILSPPGTPPHKNRVTFLPPECNTTIILPPKEDYESTDDEFANGNRYEYSEEAS